ncbi:hypothetical protein BJX64DRAFT_256694 [Aspergillus heterothallicus]
MAESQPLRRAPRACEYCRKKRLRCTPGQYPCLNCQMYRVECVYTESKRRTRASTRARTATRKRGDEAQEPSTDPISASAEASSSHVQGLPTPPARSTSNPPAMVESIITLDNNPMATPPYWNVDDFNAQGIMPNQEYSHRIPLDTWPFEYAWYPPAAETYMPPSSLDGQMSTNTDPYPTTPSAFNYPVYISEQPQYYHEKMEILTNDAALSLATERPSAVNPDASALTNNHTVYSAKSTLSVCLEQCLHLSPRFESVNSYSQLFRCERDAHELSGSSINRDSPGYLPDIRVATDGANAYFENVHPIFPFIDSQSFRDSWPGFYTGPNADIDPIVYSGFCLVVAVGTLSDASEHRVKERQKVVMEMQSKTRSLLGDIITTSTEQSVQVLLLHVILQIQLGSNHMALIMCGIATRIAQSLGLDRDRCGAEASPIEPVRYQSQIWESLFTLDSFLSALECKPSSVRDTRTPLPGQPRSKNTLICSNSKLINEISHWSIQIAQIRNRYSAVIQHPESTTHQIASLIHIYGELTRLKEQMPVNLRPDQGVLSPQPLMPSLAMLHLDYYHLLCAIHWVIIFNTEINPGAELPNPSVRLLSCEDICLSAARLFIDVLNRLANAYEGSRLFPIAFHSQSCIMVLAILYRAVVTHPRRISAKGDFEAFRAGKTHLERHANPSRLSLTLRALLHDMVATAEGFLADAEADVGQEQ